MSLFILKSGIADSIQDLGRFGYQDIGINPNGAMDEIAMTIANCLVGNPLGEAVLECFFPAARILFQEDAIISISGGDFSPYLDDLPIQNNKMMFVKAFTVLHFKNKVKGNVCYIAVKGGFKMNAWLDSKSTNIIAKQGGLEGRNLKSNDILFFQENNSVKQTKALPWQVNSIPFYNTSKYIRAIAGEEFSWLDELSKRALQRTSFVISPHSNRMAYTLFGNDLKKTNSEELISSGVVKGTIQLLPNGNLLALMADHQTTGGYPKVLQIAAIDLPTFVQLKAGDRVEFMLISIEEAENLYLSQQLQLKRLLQTCKWKIEMDKNEW